MITPGDFFNKKVEGFTLIEILVSIGVMSIIAGISISIFLSLSSAYDKANVVSTVNQEGSRVMEQMVRTIRNASNAVEIASPSGVRLTIPRQAGNLEYSSNGGCTQVELYYDDPSNSIRKTTSSCDGTSLCPSGNPCVLTSTTVEVSSASYDVTENDDSPDQVRISLVLRQEPSLSDPEQQASQQFERSVLTRGY
ncbi:prepilin-type N-terminal cleavage/methylation domain-containing protein [candidate division WWE3 bacterium]|nr:prepilin-type N-terminal cleavage/methylation domain-containing protein [candidate division WWE3 bacterium]